MVYRNEHELGSTGYALLTEQQSQRMCYKETETRGRTYINPAEKFRTSPKRWAVAVTKQDGSKSPLSMANIQEQAVLLT